jgi:hypothetical protein
LICLDRSDKDALVLAHGMPFAFLTCSCMCATELAQLMTRREDAFLGGGPWMEHQEEAECIQPTVSIMGFVILFYLVVPGEVSCSCCARKLLPFTFPWPLVRLDSSLSDRSLALLVWKFPQTNGTCLQLNRVSAVDFSAWNTNNKRTDGARGILADLKRNKGSTSVTQSIQTYSRPPNTLCVLPLLRVD